MLTRRLASTNLIIILGMMQVSKRIPFDDPNVLWGVRGLYLVSNLIILSVYLYVQSKIKGLCGELKAECQRELQLINKAPLPCKKDQFNELANHNTRGPD